MKEISIEERKQILLNMLLEIDTFCKNNNISYFLTGGTLLGAIRHKGFIPWDDDIDIVMPREDYDRFSVEFNASEHSNLKWIDYNNTVGFYLPSGKVIDTRTILIERVDYAIPIGVFVDVFPLDNVGDNKKWAEKQIKKSMIVNKIVTLKSLRLTKNRNILKNVIIAFCKLYPYDPRQNAVDRDKKNKAIAKGKEGRYVANLYGAWGSKEITLKSYFTSSIEGTFEGHQFRIPVGYDNYLRDIYGDYMKLPPIKDRVSHHGNDAFWKDEYEINKNI